MIGFLVKSDATDFFVYFAAVKHRRAAALSLTKAVPHQKPRSKTRRVGSLAMARKDTRGEKMKEVKTWTAAASRFLKLKLLLL